MGQAHTHHLLSFSGGKDSLASLCKAVERRDRTGQDFRVLVANTKNENPITEDYWTKIEALLGISFEYVEANFSAEFAFRRRQIDVEWSKEKRRKKHSTECNDRREQLGFVKAWRERCDCPVRISLPVHPDIIGRAKELLAPTGNAFLDLCMLKGRFPSRMAQFCTERLKLEPINKVVHPLLDAGDNVVSWIGERAEESDRRAKKPPIERIRWPSGSSLTLYRPLFYWTAAECFAIAKRHGIPPNPLYMMGFSRVGCMPCINEDKEGIAQIVARFPEIIDRIREWEIIVALVSRRGEATFFPAPSVLGDPEDYTRAQIDKVVAWSKTTRGGRQFDLMQALWRTQAEQDGLICESRYGLCE
jgi:3'-phosphoadenosine 5'-phosphosulfate sulfotransferase (PAPS reductase)/FAD synthetase